MYLVVGRVLVAEIILAPVNKGVTFIARNYIQKDVALQLQKESAPSPSRW